MDDFYVRNEALVTMGYLLDIISKDSLKEKMEKLNELRKEELKLLEKKLKFTEELKDLCSK